MNTIKTKVLNDNLNVMSNIFFDFLKNIKETIKEKLISSENPYDDENFPYIDFKKGNICFEDKHTCCPRCNCDDVVEYGYNTKKLYINDIGYVKVYVKRYKCKNCGKMYQTDLSSFIYKNSNITMGVIEIIWSLSSFNGNSVRNIQEILKRFHKINISSQTIENVILSYRKQNNNVIKTYSGYYIFDTLWMSIEGKWNYLLALFDVKYNTLVNFKIVSNETEQEVYNFLKESTKNQPRIAITTDLKKEYKQPIKKLGFKHQLCHFHTKKKITRDIKRYIKENNISKEEKDKINKERKILNKIIYNKSVKHSYKRIKKILKYKDKFSPIIIEILIEFILPNLKNLKYYRDSKYIENTSNKLENFFQKMFPKSLKKKIKTKEGIEARMYLKLINWNLNNLKDVIN